MKNYVAIQSLREIEAELEAVRAALADARRRSTADPGALPLGSGVTATHLRRAADNAEATYIIRLFASFEAVARDYWETVKPRARPRAEHLVRRLASHRRISHDILCSH